MTLIANTELAGPLDEQVDTHLPFGGPRRYTEQALAILPGLVLNSTIAGAAFGLRMLPGMATFSPMILSIMIAIAFHNIVGTADWAKAGVTFCLRRLLRLAIVL